MKHLSRTAPILSALLNIVFWGLLAWALFHGGTVLMGTVNILRGSANGIITVSGVTLDYLFLRTAEGLEIPHHSHILMSIISLGHYFLLVPLMCLGLRLLRKILLCVEQQRPFSGTAAIMRRLGWLSTALAILSNLLSLAKVSALQHLYRLEDFFVGDTISAVEFRFRPDYTFVAVAVVVFLLAAVFRYGEELQQLSDETL